MLRGSIQARPVTGQRRRVLVVLTVVIAQFFFWFSPAATNAASPSQTTDLRVLVIDDGSSWIAGMTTEMTTEGVPFTAVSMSSATRPIVNAAFLASGDHAFYQSVVMPSRLGLAGDELTALRTYEAAFGVREVDMYNWPEAADGLQFYAYSGDATGFTGTVTPAAKADGFGYLNGPITFGIGSSTYISAPADPATLAPGATYTPFLTMPAPAPSTVTGSVIGVYSSGGVEQMIITAAMASFQTHFKILAHGIITWMTHGLHLGYQRNNMTFHVDDAFSDVAQWDPTYNCTPGEDCPVGSPAVPTSIRLTPADVDKAVAWEAANDYTLTLAYNGYSANAATDPLTQSLVANKSAFKWLNHGLEHIYQGCVQDFTVTPWKCVTDASGNIQWVSQLDIYNEITNNIAVAASLGLPIDPTEYLSGEHSGLYLTPQQPTDNPNFVAALGQAGIKTIGADASREPGARLVGSAITVPRHPTILYYNAATIALEVDEYNWLYTTKANGGGGYCEANPTTATCGPVMTPADYVAKIVPADAAYDLTFILSNDPRPFYAHTSNMGADGTIYPLLESILGTYRSAFAANTPLTNLTMTQASAALTHQSDWATTGMTATPQATASVKGGVVTITNTGTKAVPITAPVGTSVSGVTLESYAGELSGWLPGAPTTTVTLAGLPVITTGGSNTFVVAGTAGSFTMAATGPTLPAITVTGTIPAGLTFAAAADGTATITGTPTSPAGSYPITVTATNTLGSTSVPATLVVNSAPSITSAAATSAQSTKLFTFPITTTGLPVATLTETGALPTGVTFTPNTTGGAALGGTPGTATPGIYPLTITATNSAGATSQAFTLTITGTKPVFTSAVSKSTPAGAAFTFAVTTTGSPAAALTETGALPTGVTFTPNATGGATLAGTPGVATVGNYPLTFTATSTAGITTQAFTLTITGVPAFTSAATAGGPVGTAFTFSVTATGTPAPTITRTGTLPGGVTFTANTNGTATIAGTPTTSGTFPLTLTATNTAGTVRQSFVLTVSSVLAFTSANSATFNEGSNTTFTVRTSGTPAPAITLSGALPSGVTFRNNGNGTATLSGRAAANTSGTYALTLTATNGGGTVTQAFTLTVHQAPNFTSSGNLTATHGQAVNFTVTTTGSPAATIAKIGNLPAGLIWTANANGTATITGTPTARTTSLVILTATNAAGIDLQLLIIRIN
jgi:Putative Ig domain